MAKTNKLRIPLRAAAVVATILIVAYVLVPQLAGVHLSLLARINTGYLALGIGLQAAFLVAYACLTRTVLPRSSELGLPTVARINLSTLAISHLVPGGTAAGTALAYRMLTRFGVRCSDACFALGTQGLGSAVVLNAILWLTLIVSIPLHGFDPRYVTAAVIGTVLIGFCFGLVLLLTRGREQAAKLTGAIAGRFPFLNEDSVRRGVHRFADRLATMRADRALMARAFGWAAAAWLLDAASLGVFVAGFGYRVSPYGLLIAFGLANVLGAIPITPRGLGIVEAVLIPTLIAFGTPHTTAVLGVISYRLVNFWAPIPIGGAAYLSLRRKLASWNLRPTYSPVGTMFPTQQARPITLTAANAIDL
jgi:putative heme transporter